MSGNEIKVNHGSVEEQGRALATRKNEVEAALNAANAQIQELHSSGAFVGLAGDSFNTTFTEWHTSATKVIALLEDFGMHLGKTSKAFEEVDSAFSLKV